MKHVHPTYTRTQIIVAVAMLFASAGMGLMAGSNRFDLTIAGLAIFGVSAYLVCKLGD